MARANPLSNQRGQLVIEAVLLMVLSLSLLVYATGQIQERQWLGKLIASPWQQIAGMLESGVWAPANTARSSHPNQIPRVVSIDPNKD